MNTIKVWNAPKNFIWIQIYCSGLKLVRCDGFYGRGRGFTRSRGAPRSSLHFGWLYFVHISHFVCWFFAIVTRVNTLSACSLDGFILFIFLIWTDFCWDNFKLWGGFTRSRGAPRSSLHFGWLYFVHIFTIFLLTACILDGFISFILYVFLYFFNRDNFFDLVRWIY